MRININLKKVENVAEKILNIPTPAVPIHDWLKQDVEDVAEQILKVINDNNLTTDEMTVLDEYLRNKKPALDCLCLTN